MYCSHGLAVLYWADDAYCDESSTHGPDAAGAKGGGVNGGGGGDGGKCAS
tara:strand:- start:50 stop:199 length:150 start_codon:yes stop_codon:yes gene_type:complete